MRMGGPQHGRIGRQYRGQDRHQQEQPNDAEAERGLAVAGERGEQRTDRQALLRRGSTMK
jgi:hypothetical protein